MMATDAALNGLKRQRPEWEPWLVVVEEILRETASHEWDAAVPERVDARPAAPLLAGTTATVRPASIRRLLDRIIGAASSSTSAKMATLQRVRHADLDVMELFNTAIVQDCNRMNDVAARAGADGEAFQAVVTLLPVPFLHACHRRFASATAESWVEGYCPVCGSWPAFAEVLGIERRRQLRCGRCGGAWHGRCLSCPFCGEGDHDALVSLVPDDRGARGTIDACTSCLGYLKTFTRLQGSTPDAVMLDDLASVDLDVAALSTGYKRPAGAGHPLQMTVIPAAKRRLFAWNA